MITRRTMLTSGAITGAAALALNLDEPFGHLSDEERGARGFPNYTLQAHDGRHVHFYDDLMKGRLTIARSISAPSAIASISTETAICPKAQRSICAEEFGRITRASSRARRSSRRFPVG